MNRNLTPIIALIIVTSLLLAACGSSDSTESESTSASSAAMVDGVTVDFRENHYYAIVTGVYPDACTQISDMKQEVNDKAFEITLSTARPGDLMCAQMIIHFEVALLIETGGLPPGEYTVDVNGISTNFTLGE
jgi:hypothetical protein